MLVIDYYSDILCIWAQIAQRRLEELDEQFPGQLDIRHHCMNIFGNVAEKMDNQWQERGGYAGFAQHVHEAASTYCEQPLHPEVWHAVQPRTSANAHLYIKAVSLTAGTEAAAAFTQTLRQAFFGRALDISSQSQLHELAEESRLDCNAVRATFESGEALADLFSDYERAKQLHLKGSPFIYHEQ